MARPKKSTVEYFPHDTKHGSTMLVLESKWGNNGYSFWFKLLELLGSHDNHFMDCRKPAEWELLTAKTRLSDPVAKEILDTLAKLEAIDNHLWQQHNVIVSINFISRIEDAYRKRKDRFPTLENIYTALNITISGFLPEETPINGFKDGKSTERERERERERESNTEEDDGAIQFSKMSINDFRFLFSDKFGQNMPGGCNATASELCQTFTKDEIIRAFDVASEQGKLTIAYVKGVLMGNGDKKQNKVTRLQTFADAKEARAMEQHLAFLEEN